MVLLIHPGHADIKHLNAVAASDNTEIHVSAFDKVLDLVRNMFPENIMRATFSQVETSYVSSVVGGPDGNNITTVKLHKQFIEGIDVLGKHRNGLNLTSRNYF